MSDGIPKEWGEGFGEKWSIEEGIFVVKDREGWKLIPDVLTKANVDGKYLCISNKAANSFIDDDSIKQCAEILARNEICKLSIFLRCHLTLSRESSMSLSKELGSSTTLELLNFRNVEFNLETTELILPNILSGTSPLQQLYLQKCNIRDDSAAVLATALESNKTLLELDLSSNRIADDGAMALAEALSKNTTLTDLKLSDNLVGNVGAAFLVTNCNSPFSLDLTRNNAIESIGISWIAAALKHMGHAGKSLPTVSIRSVGEDDAWIQTPVGDGLALRLFKQNENIARIENVKNVMEKKLTMYRADIEGIFRKARQGEAEAKKSIGILQGEKAVIEKSLENQININRQYVKELAKITREKTVAETSLSEVRKEKEKVDTSLEKTLLEKTDLEDIIARTKKQNVEVEGSLQDQISENKKQAARLVEVKKEKIATEEALAEAKDQGELHLAKISKVIEEKTAAESSLSQLRKENEKIDTTLTKTRKEKADLEESISRAKKQRTELEGSLKYQMNQNKKQAARLVEVKEEKSELEKHAEKAMQENEKLKDDIEKMKECAVCQERDKCVVLFPCSHLALCAGCESQVNNICPICRGKIKKSFKVNIA